MFQFYNLFIAALFGLSPVLNQGKLIIRVGQAFNPNKAGLFEGSFFWGGQFDPSFIFKDELKQYQYNFTHLLDNLNADIICYMLT